LADVRALRERLSSASADVDIEALGDSLILPQDMKLSSRSEVARLFGDEFVDGIVKAEQGRWNGPIRSGYGLHIVFVHERDDGRMPTLAEVRPLVEREFSADRRQRQLQAMYERLLDRYQVVIEKRASVPRAADAASEKSQEGAK
jgi:hypothetical protein